MIVYKETHSMAGGTIAGGRMLPPSAFSHIVHSRYWEANFTLYNSMCSVQKEGNVKTCYLYQITSKTSIWY